MNPPAWRTTVALHAASLHLPCCGFFSSSSSFHFLFCPLLAWNGSSWLQIGSAQLVANLTLHSWLAAGCTPGMAEVLETLPRQGVPMYTAVMKAYASLGKVATMFFLLAEETLSLTLLYLLRFNILASSCIFLSGIHSFARCRKSNQGSGFASENSPICRFR